MMLRTLAIGSTALFLGLGCSPAEEKRAQETETTQDETTAVEKTTVEETTIEAIAAEETPESPSQETQHVEAVATTQDETPPEGITPEQAENRRIYEERAENYNGTGPSPWVQGQLDWMAENQATPESYPQPTSRCHEPGAACDESQPGIQTEREMEAYWKANSPQAR